MLSSLRLALLATSARLGSMLILRPGNHLRALFTPFKAPLRLNPTRRRAVTVSAASSEDEKAPPLELATANWKGLEKEAKRRQDRAIKKIAKKSSRLSTLEEVGEDAEDYIECEYALAEATRERDELGGLIDSLLQDQATIDEANRLGLSDEPPARTPRGGPKKKVQPSGPRMPYTIYSSESDVKIRVGRNAKDNDLLSISREHRDNADWWMHAAGHAGSHVVIRSHNDDFPDSDRETVMDAACLAALFSKAIAKPPEDSPHAATGSARVSLCRARDVSKPSGVAAGMVQLRGDVRTISVNLSNEQNRLKRILQTKT